MLSQRVLAREFDCDQPVFLRWLRRAGLDSSRLRDPDTAILATCVGELTRCGLSGSMAGRLVGESRAELLHIARNGASSWSVVFRPWGTTPDATIATSAAQLADIASAQPLTVVVALPRLVGAARATLARLEASLA